MNEAPEGEHLPFAITALRCRRQRLDRRQILGQCLARERQVVVHACRFSQNSASMPK